MIPNQLQAKFQEDVLNIIARTKNGEESLSFTLSEMRYKGWKNLGRLHDFEDSLEAAGFHLRRETKPGGSILRTYVTL